MSNTAGAVGKDLVDVDCVEKLWSFYPNLLCKKFLRCYLRNFKY